MEADSRSVALTAFFAALYVVMNIVQMNTIGNPTVYGPIQLRLADSLIALTALLGPPVAFGVTIGCFLTNAYYFLGVQDVLLGSVANLLAASIVFLLWKRRFLACVAGTLPIGLIVGSYLWMFPFLRPPEVFGAIPAWAAMILSVTISSLIAVAGLGYLLLVILSRPSIVKPLQSRGLKVMSDEA